MAPSATAERLVAGAIDMHVHSAPDLRPRKLDDWELVTRAERAGMRAVVLKNHFTPTADRAQLLRSRSSLSIWGSIVLNESVGGLNAAAVDVALGLGAKVVWMPTVSAAHHAERAGSSDPGSGLRVVRDGHVSPSVERILASVAAAGAVLATGHVSPAESAVLVGAALRAGVKRVVITHPASYLVAMPLEQQVVLARQGAIIEIAYVTTRQRYPVQIDELAAHARAIGTGSVIVTTDLGQPENPYPVDGLRELIQGMLDAGISEDDARTMVQRNPQRLLGLAQ